jgi:polar amino acid transport system substrate-binding protein
MDETPQIGMDRRALLTKGVGAAMLGGAGFLLAACQTTTPNPSGGVQSATGRLAEVLNRKKLLVGTGTGNPPWHFDDGGKLAGFDVDMAKIIANGLFKDPEAVEFVQEASDARIPNLLTNKVDVVFQFMTVNPARAQQIQFTIPYYREGIGFLLAANGQYADYNALKAAGSAARVSILQNPDVDKLIHSVLPEAQVQPLDSQANVIQALDSNRVDAAAIDQSTVRWLNVQDAGKYKDSGFGFQPQTYAAGVRPGDDVWLRFLDTALHEALTGVSFGEYAASFKKWFGVDLPSPTIGFPLEFATAS